MKIGDELYLFYDGRPFVRWVRAYRCEIVKILKTGFKIKNLDASGEYEDVILTSSGGARGWNTLTWEPVSSDRAKGDYEFLREKMKEGIE